MKVHRGAETVRRQRRWPLIAAMAWSIGVGVVGMLWATAVLVSPLGKADRRYGEVGSVFDGMTASQTGLVAVGIGLVGIGLAVAMGSRAGNRWPGVAAAGLSLVLCVVVPDLRVVQNFAYAFAGVTQLWEGGLAAMVTSMLGAAIWGWLAFERLGGRIASGSIRPPRWAVPMTYAAALFALPYPIVRIAWGLGIPLGAAGDTELAQATLGERLGMVLLLGGLPVAGAVLTIGLVRRWGEVFPGWLPVLGGRPVPIWFAVVPGLVAAALICQGGIRVLAWVLDGGVTVSAADWGSDVPGLFFLPWGLTLTAAVYAYAVRRLRAVPA